MTPSLQSSDSLRYPLEIGSSTRKGPALDGEQVAAGDILAHRGSAGYQVVSGINSTASGVGVALFDPRDLSTTEYHSNNTDALQNDWYLRRRRLGHATTLSEDETEQLFLLLSYDRDDGVYSLRWGRAPLGALAVDIPPSASIPAESLSAITDVIGRGTDDPSSILLYRQLSDSEDKIATLCKEVYQQVTDRPVPDEDHGSVVPESAFFTTDHRIPTVEDGAVSTPGPKPGDRWVWWGPSKEAPASLSSVSSTQLYDGDCVVLLSDGSPPPETYGTLYDLFEKTTEPATSSRLETMDQRARTNGVNLSLLARDCHVEPLEDTTYSVHLYKARRGEGDTTYILAADKLATVEPRLEHPLSLEVAQTDTLPGILDILRGDQERGHPLAQWVTANQSFADTCRSVATRAARYNDSL